MGKRDGDGERDKDGDEKKRTRSAEECRGEERERKEKEIGSRELREKEGKEGQQRYHHQPAKKHLLFSTSAKPHWAYHGIVYLAAFHQSGIHVVEYTLPS
ncbi:hypothetical protein G5I_09576 [Acromyrmex echinatior]|uniref:Uncharacterized protein n=1 Tax=Acromyrmex echinatior TaxID=103372 RepID=F4WUK4_ACREC|nr:hypothetical protein G5I_09576 [Acromyrmex echinatior]